MLRYYKWFVFRFSWKIGIEYSATNKTDKEFLKKIIEYKLLHYAFTMSSVNPCVIDMFVETLKKINRLLQTGRNPSMKVSTCTHYTCRAPYIWYKFIMINLLIYSTN